MTTFTYSGIVWEITHYSAEERATYWEPGSPAEIEYEPVEIDEVDEVVEAILSTSEVLDGPRDDLWEIAGDKLAKAPEKVLIRMAERLLADGAAESAFEAQADSWSGPY